MAGNPFKKVKANDPFDPSAEAWNSFIDTTVKFKEFQQQKNGGEVGKGLTQRIEVLVKNNSGSDAHWLGILGIGTSEITEAENSSEFKSRIVLDGEAPATATHKGKFVVCQEVIPDGEIGKACVMGMTAVLIDVTDADHTHADVKNADATQLSSAPYGMAKIIYKPAGTGSKWSLVALSHNTGVRPGEATTGQWSETHLAAITTTETANASTWSWGTNGLKLRIFRYTYAYDGNEILYGFWRDIQFTPDGKLHAVSAETRFTVDTPGACP